MISLLSLMVDSGFDTNVEMQIYDVSGLPPKIIMLRVAAHLSGTCEGKLVFARLMRCLPLNTFRRCLADHRSEHKLMDF